MHYLTGWYEVSERRATRAARFCLSSLRYQSHRDPLTALRQPTRELAQTRVRFGYRRLLVLPRREGWELGKKRAVLIASTPRKDWRCDGNDLASRVGGPPRAETTSDGPATTSEAWISSRINWPTDTGFVP